MNIEFGDILTSIVVLISIFGAVIAYKSYKETERSNSLLFEKKGIEAEDYKKADINVSVTSFGSKNKKLKIFNKGKSTAKNICVFFPGGDDFVSQSEISCKFPLEILEPLQSIELQVRCYIGMSPKRVIKITWDDDFQKNREKIAHITIW